MSTSLKMKPEIKARWCAALRSDEYKQTTYCLNDSVGFCCLGVLADLHAKETGRQWSTPNKIERRAYLFAFDFLPREVANWAGLEDVSPRVLFDGEGGSYSRELTSLNDDKMSFQDIASYIEASL